MSGFQSSAPLTAALLASKGRAAPSRSSMSSLLNGFDDEAPAVTPAVTMSPVSAREDGEDGNAAQSSFSGGKGSGSGRAPSRKNPAADKARIKLSLRLTDQQHLRLKLAAAHLRQSSQTILMAALEDYLARKAPEIGGGDCACLMAGSEGGRTAMPSHGEPYGNAN